MMLRLLLLLLAFLALPATGEEFLDPAVAFKPSVRAVDGRTIEVEFHIAPGYYLYRDKFRFSVEDDAARTGTPVFPPGKEKEDETFGRMVVYYDAVAVTVPVERSSPGELPLRLKVTSQGCADAGVCYPPQSHILAVTLPSPDAPPAPKSAAGSETGRIAQALKHAGFWGNLAFFFVAGLGLALTPCVFPMIPILSGIIAGQGHRASHARGFALSLAYVLGMALTYAAAGVAAGLSGTLISSALQNPWVLGSFAAVFVVLSLSMFGFYELQLPTALQSKLSQEAGHLQGGRGVGVFLMGALSALIVGPCVAAPLAGALLYIGQTGDAVLGGAALFVMALGMGVPLIAVGLSAGSLLPRTGPWMEAVKKAFGVVLLATAVWLVGPVIPAAAQMLAWAVLLIIPAIFLHALDPLPPTAKGWQRFWKGIGIVMLLTGAALLVGALAGGRDPLQPLASLRGQAVAAETPHLPFQRVATVDELDARLKAAAKPVMLDFYADWCVSCKEMERFTFADAGVRERLKGFELLQADVTANSDADKALLARFGLFGPPGIIFFDPAGRELANLRVVGYKDAAAFAAVVDQARRGG
ncbi:MAG: protein-disulfide reductase DsbD [Azonexus sp.]|nr:protein-disulfide reductase DsbD [Betaproteobacteria bacterium]MBK8919625.1 protein-disulfide reductase DsbD [Betaproteobacteria bacterium]MBP6034866.1 protein-disulfide reductase DsbD [Azonexus sp.]MBP6905572.1 protein-disulfide reductase DsbD [Azonexus sp.]